MVAVVTAVVTVAFSACTITFKGTFVPDDEASLANNMVDVDHLGVGFDRIYMDPEDLSLNSVQGQEVRPRVFEFSADPNPYHTIDIPRLGNNSDGPQRQNMVLGVAAEANPRFEWIEDENYIYSSSDFRSRNEKSFFASAGVEGIASFSGSTSFKRIKETTQGSKNMYKYTDGTFRGYSLALKKGYPHKLTKEFRTAVLQLSTPEKYREFISDWGTHYSHSVTMGAKCSYRLRFNQENDGSYFGSERNLEVKVSGGIKQLELGFGAGDSKKTVKEVQSETHSSEIRFISYGGSGAGTSDFGLWSQHATLNPTPVNVSLVSYIDLLSTFYFPKDTLIQKKKQLLENAYKAYYLEKQIAFPDESPRGNKTDFFRQTPAEYKVEVLFYSVNNLSDREDNAFAGNLTLGWVTPLSKYDMLASIFSSQEQGQNISVGMFKQKALVLKKGVPTPSELNGKFTVPVNDLKGLNLYVTGEIQRLNNDFFPTITSFPPIGPGNDNGKVTGLDLGMLEKGEQELVSFSMSSDDNQVDFKIDFRVTRLK